MALVASSDSMADRRPRRPTDLQISSASHQHPFAHNSKPARYAEVRKDRGSMNSEASAPGLMDDQASDVSADDDYQYQASGDELWDSWQNDHTTFNGAYAMPATSTRSPELFFATNYAGSPLLSPSAAAISSARKDQPRPVGHEAFISHKASDSFSRSEHLVPPSTADPVSLPMPKFFDASSISYLPPQLPPPTSPLPQLPLRAPRSPRALRTAKSHGVLNRSDASVPPRSTSLARPMTPTARPGTTSSHHHSSSFAMRQGQGQGPRRPPRPDEKVLYSPFPTGTHSRNHSRSHSNANSIAASGHASSNSTGTISPRAMQTVDSDDMQLFHQLCMERSRPMAAGARPATSGLSGLGQNKSAFDDSDSDDEVDSADSRPQTGLQRLMKGLQKRSSQEKWREPAAKEKNMFSRMFTRSK
ncbi:hypothetical protein CFIMG_007956RA00001 [Ceratocystis fimbriata CBS 114723]|uniref:Uncharacterized protein n=1 Tax=Ceratocystis fimbriata CBS 114723 TaxID=1035309 RepID=A0A2C5XB60_9PEZI|nr:hypothetical protein CFIMG_007956RA00001 [Ceratocystis fimbriata CBS 114723]